MEKHLKDEASNKRKEEERFEKLQQKFGAPVPQLVEIFFQCRFEANEQVIEAEAAKLKQNMFSLIMFNLFV